MRESFVLHSEYIEDLPEEYKIVFLEYIYNYGIHEQAPALEGLERSLWLKIQRRIDIDHEAYNKKLEYLKEYRKNKKHANSSNSSESSQKFEKFENIQTISPSVIDIVSDIDIVNDIDIDIDNVSVSDANLTPAQKEYSKAVFTLWSEAGLPGSKDEFSFRSKEFYQSIPALKGIHSNDVLQAIKNYVSVLKDKSCYLKKKYCFDTFVTSKIFKEVLPDRFVKANFKRFDVSGISNDEDVSKYSLSKVAAK